MRWIVAVTFESETQPPKTWRGEVVSAGAPSAMRQGLKAAKLAYKGAKWQSLCLILEKAHEPVSE